MIRSRPRPMAGRVSLALWLGVIAVFGVIRFAMRANRSGEFAPDAIAWMWLAGGVIVGVATIVAVVHALRR